MLATTIVAKRFGIASQSAVYAIACADESQVVGGYENGEIRRWKVEGGQQRGPTIKAGSDIYSLVVSRDGRWIVTGCRAKKVTVWNAATHEKVHEFVEHPGPVWGVDISSDCNTIASVDRNAARTFSVTSGLQLLPPLRHHYAVRVKFSPDGSRFATASCDRHGCRVYDTHSGNILFDSGPGGSVGATLATSLVWSSDGQQLFVANVGIITCFNFSSSSPLKWPIHETRSCTSVSIASNGRFIACSAGSSVSLWDCASHSQIGNIITHSADICSVALSPAGGYLACGLNDGKITIHNLGDILYHFDHNSPLYNDSIPRPPRASYETFTSQVQDDSTNSEPSEEIAGPLGYLDYGFHTSQLRLTSTSEHSDCGLPLVQASNEVLKPWTRDDLVTTERLLSKQIASTTSPSYHALANCALIRARLKRATLAVKDANRSLQVQRSPIGYIAKAVALLGEGNQEGALRVFDLTFRVCDPRDNELLLLLKSVLVFESGHQEDAITDIERLATRANDGSDNDTAYLCAQILGVMYIRKGSYARAILWIEYAKELAPENMQSPPLKTISLIFGWNFTGLSTIAHPHICEILYAEGHTAEAVKIFNIIKTSDGKVQATVGWIAHFAQRCVRTLEDAGDEAFGFTEYDNAIAQYSAALSLSPPTTAALFIKRSKARAAKELWEDAAQDADEAMEADPSNPWGYRAKHVALHGAKRYDEAIDAFKSALSVMEQSHDPAIRQMRRNCISPSDTIAIIDAVVDGIVKNAPLVVIDTETGCLCEGSDRKRIFKESPTFKELVSSMTSELDKERIQQVVNSFFGYVMFSHAWQGKEPSFQDVKKAESVWYLPGTPLNEKLRRFCRETRRLGYNWAWSDTCCIGKTMSSILNQSLTSMYRWYADSAATIVFLAGVAHPSTFGDLTRSLWMTRAWTLQELLAPKVVFFYDSEWNLYLRDTSANHKKSPKIMQELIEAIKIPPGTIDTFSPDDLGVREKLRLASTRNATVEEDVAYSLIGIFKSDIRPHYGEGADAVGHLLEEIVARSGEVTVLAWSGKSSSYNSCLPASVSVYSQTPHNPPSLEGEEMNACIRQLCGKLSEQEALSICKRINSLQPVRFATRRLHLPCIVFPVKGLTKQGFIRGSEILYQAEVFGLGGVGFVSADDLQLDKRQKFVLAHPWISHIRGPSGGVTWEDDFERDPHSDPSLDYSTVSDGVVPQRAVLAPDPGRYVQALQMIARLGQPFNALLLAKQPNGEYKRVATENEIVVPGLGTNITPKCILTKVLDIL